MPRRICAATTTVHHMAGLYIHVPFCSSSCPYCDYFHVVGGRSTARFAAALCAELEQKSLSFGTTEGIGSIYFGGGTPSRLSPDELGLILTTVERFYSISSDAEITLECNPEDVSEFYALALSGLRINRLVLGAQSFYQRDLELLGRRHKDIDIEYAVLMARQAGIDNVSLDLMLAVPGQPREYWAANLERAANLDIPHLSTYELTLEPDSELLATLQQKKCKQLTQEERADQMFFTMGYLRSRGYNYYELTNYAKPGSSSRHTALYSNHGNVIGFGPSAHSFWWHKLPRTGVHRWVNVSNAEEYVDRVLAGESVVEEDLVLDPDTLAREYVLLRLRTAHGIDLERLENDYGFDLLTERVEALAELESELLIHPIRNGRLQLTDSGRLLCESVGKLLIP